MKNIIIRLFAILSAVFIAAGCIEETFPKGGTITAGQLDAAPTALQAVVNGIPSAMMASGTAGYASGYGYHADFGISAIHLMTETMLEDFTLSGDLGYFWFGAFFQNVSMGDQYIYPAYFWDCYYAWIKLVNDIIVMAGEVDENTDANILGALGQAYVYRAMCYLDLARLYEPKDNDLAPIHDDIKGLTVPIVDEYTTEDIAKNNPRAERMDMYDFIFSDLETALEYLNPADKSYTKPTVAAVYGLYARAYLELGAAYKEDGDQTSADTYYAKAAYNARKAIEVSGKTPLTAAEWHDPRTGFNNGGSNNSWIWGLTLSVENASNIITNIAHIASEAVWGYSILSLPSINKATYDRIAFDDFRKKSFLDPDYTWLSPDYPWNTDPTRYVANNGYEFCGQDDPLSGMESIGINNAHDYFMYYARPYVNLKFRPANGQTVEYTEGNCADHVLMRVEEMYFIEVEAVSKMSKNTSIRITSADGKEERITINAGINEAQKLMNTFMQTYRYDSYDCSRVTSDLAFTQEMLFQKRVEFWGEGILFYDYKRLDQGITRGYKGTNFPAVARFNCSGRSPQWNIVIPRAECQSNIALDGKNNPDPTELLVPWTE